MCHYSLATVSVVVSSGILRVDAGSAPLETVNQNSAANRLLSVSRTAMPATNDRDDLMCSNSLWWGRVLIKSLTYGLGEII